MPQVINANSITLDTPAPVQSLDTPRVEVPTSGLVEAGSIMLDGARPGLEPPPFPIDRVLDEQLRRLSFEQRASTRSGLTSALYNSAVPWMGAGYGAASALNRSLAGLMNTLDLLDSYTTRHLGMPRGSILSNAQKLVEENAQYWENEIAKNGASGITKLFTFAGEMIGGLIPGTLDFVLKAASGLTIPFITGTERATQEHKIDPFIGGMVEASKTGVLKQLFEMLGPFSKWVKGSVLGTTFGVEGAAAAPEGKRLEAFFKEGATGAFLGLTSPSGDVTLRDVYPELMSRHPDVQRESGPVAERDSPPKNLRPAVKTEEEVTIGREGGTHEEMGPFRKGVFGETYVTEQPPPAEIPKPAPEAVAAEEMFKREAAPELPGQPGVTPEFEATSKKGNKYYKYLAMWYDAKGKQVTNAHKITALEKIKEAYEAPEAIELDEGTKRAEEAKAAEIEAEGKDIVSASRVQQLDMHLEKAIKIEAGYQVLKEVEDTLLGRIKNWLLGKGEQPKNPPLYRGVPKDRELGLAKEGEEYLHGTPWPFGAARGGKGAWGDPTGHDVYMLPSSKETLYYRGGSLSGDPLERTRIASERGMTWDQLMKAGQELFQRELTKRRAEEAARLKEFPDEAAWKMSDEELASQVADAVAVDIKNGAFEVDLRGKPGLWAEGGLPYLQGKELPRLRSNEDLENVIWEKRRQGFDEEHLRESPEGRILQRIGRYPEPMAHGELAPEAAGRVAVEAAAKLRDSLRGGRPVEKAPEEEIEDIVFLSRAKKPKKEEVSPIDEMEFKEDMSPIETEFTLDKTNLLPTLLTNIANQNPSRTMIYELVQNSLDALPRGGGKIDIIHEDLPWPENGHKLIVKDTGHGMLPEEVKKFFLVGGSIGKSGIESRGGYGLAKIAFLLIPDKVKLTSVKGGIRSTVEVTREELAEGKVIINREKAPDASPGTKLEATLPRKFQHWGMGRFEWEDAVDSVINATWSTTDIHAYRSVSGTGLIVHRKNNPRVLEAVEKRSPSDYINHEGSEIAIHYVATEPYGYSWSPIPNYTVDSMVTNKGLVIDTKTGWLKGMAFPTKPDFRVVIDFVKTPTVRDPNYPFFNNRTEMREAVQKAIIPIVEAKLGRIRLGVQEARGRDFKAMMDSSPELRTGVKILNPLKGESRDKANVILMDNKSLFEEFSDVILRFNEMLRTVGEDAKDFHLTIDPTVYGYKSNPDLTGVDIYAINPIALSGKIQRESSFRAAVAKGVDPARLQADAMTHTLIHEWAHKKVFDHTELFTIELHRLITAVGHDALKDLKDQIGEFYDRHGEKLTTVHGNLQDVFEGGVRLKEYTEDAAIGGISRGDKEAIQGVPAEGTAPTAAAAKVEPEKPVKKEKPKEKPGEKPTAEQGFADPSGKFLNGEAAREWMKKNQPDVYLQWLKGQKGNEKAELQMKDYNKAVEEIAAGAPDMDIERLTEQLGSMSRDASFEDKQVLAEQMKQKYGEAQGAARTALAELKATGTAAWSWYKNHAIRWGTVEQLLRGYAGTKQISNMKVARFVRKIQEKMPKDLQEALSVYMESGGDEILLAKWSTNERLKKACDDAMRLTDEQKAFAKDARIYWDKKLDENIEAGILEGGLASYVMHIAEKERDHPAVKRLLGEVNAGVFKKNPSYAKKRIHETFFDMVQEGITPKDMRIGYLIGAYQRAFDEAVATKALLRDATELDAADGRPLCATRGKGIALPKGQKPAESWLIRPRAISELKRVRPESQRRIDEIDDWLEDMRGKRAGGVSEKRKELKAERKELKKDTETIDTSDYVTIPHPSFTNWKWVTKDNEGRPIFVQGDIAVHPEIARQIKNLLGESWFKKYKFTSGILKMSSGMKGTMLGMLSTFHQVHLAETVGMSYWDNPFNPKSIDLDSPLIRLGLKHGLFLYDGYPLAEFREGVAGPGLIKYIPGLGKWAEQYTEYLFGLDGYIPRLKGYLFEKNYEYNSKKYPELSEDQLLKLSADQANAAIGGMGATQLGRSKTFQDLLRLGLLAPDFLEARLAKTGQALSPYGARQLTTLAIRGAITLAIGCKVIEAITTALDPDKNKIHLDRPFSVTAWGKEYTVRSPQGDMWHLLRDPRSFIYYRLNPWILKPLVEGVWGRDNWGRKRDAVGVLQDWATSAVPIAGQGFFSKQDYTLYQSILQSLGVSSWDARSQAERTLREIQMEKFKAPQEAATKERFRLRTKLADQYIETKDFEPIRKAIKEGKIPLADLSTILERVFVGDLARGIPGLTVPEALRVWDKAGSDERELIQPILIRNWFQWQATEAERAPFEDAVNKVIDWKPAEKTTHPLLKRFTIKER